MNRRRFIEGLMVAVGLGGYGWLAIATGPPLPPKSSDRFPRLIRHVVHPTRLDIRHDGQGKCTYLMIIDVEADFSDDALASIVGDADAWRSRIVPDVIPGYFRESISFTLGPDGRSMKAHIVDVLRPR